MTSDDDPCPACGETDGVCYRAEDGRFRMFCAFCGHSTESHSDLALAQLEWRGSREAADS